MTDLDTELVAALAGQYAIERVLGRGGMGVVYLARDLKHGRLVALKVLRPEVANTIGADRFLREIAIVAPLSHPNILALHDSGKAGGILYYVMPYVEGQSLRQRLDRDVQLSIETALSIARQLAAALDHAHARGVVHRDIKPENILLSGDHVLVADFGLAKALSSSTDNPLTERGFVVGTAAYMSPEQCTPGRSVDQRSDIYSLACVVFEMIAGVPPFRGATAPALLAHHLTTAPPSLCAERSSCPNAVDAAVRKALSKAPADRFGSAGEFAAALDREPVFGRRGRVALMAGAAAVVLIGAALVARHFLENRLRENDWVLVTDFAGPAGDPRLPVALRDLVTTALSQSRLVRVLDRRQLNEVMRNAGIAETTPVDAELGRQLAQRSSVRGILLGSIQPAGTNYSIVLHVVSAEDGSELASSSGLANGSDLEQTLVGAVEDRVRELRERMGERRVQIQANRPLREVLTPSFEAFRRYSAALDRYVIQGDVPGSNQLLREAIGFDSTFASAWAAIGTNYVSLRQHDSASFAYAKALTLSNRLSPAETYRLKGDVAYLFDRDLPAAIQWYDLYLAEVPHSRSGRSLRAIYYTALGQYEKALADVEVGVALNPFGPELNQPTLLNRAAMLVALGRTGEAREASAGLSGQFAHYMHIMIPTAESRWASADSAAAAVVGASPAPAAVFVINAITARAAALAARGAIQEADSLLRASIAASRGSTARWYERARLQLHIAMTGRVEPRTDLVASDTTPSATMLRGLWAAAAGDTAAARAALGKLQNLSPRVRGNIGAGPDFIQAWIDARGNHWREVVSALQQVALEGEHDPTILDRPDSFGLRWLVAAAYEQLGKLDSATVFYELILQPTRLPPGHYALRGFSHSLAHHKLAALYARTGDRKAALRHLDAFLAAFVNADATSQPLVAGARSARARLSGTAGAPERQSRPSPRP